MSNPLISIVIPTRNRPDTLEVCLRAMRLHQSQAIEIIVQDNCSDQRTIDIIAEAAAADPRIRHSKAPFPTSQRENLEHGLAATTGDYLAIIGDDDGYSLGSLDWLAERLVQTPVDAVRCIAEMKMNPVRQPAWFTVEPKQPYDADIIAAVRAAFPDGNRAPPIAVDNKRAFKDKLPSRRVKEISPGLPDDVEGAMKALVTLTGSGTSRFEQAPTLESRLAVLVGRAANAGRRIAPGLSLRVFNSRFFPVGLWRYIKKTQWHSGKSN